MAVLSFFGFIFVYLEICKYSFSKPVLKKSPTFRQTLLPPQQSVNKESPITILRPMREAQENQFLQSTYLQCTPGLLIQIRIRAIRNILPFLDPLSPHVSFFVTPPPI